MRSSICRHASDWRSFNSMASASAAPKGTARRASAITFMCLRWRKPMSDIDSQMLRRKLLLEQGINQRIDDLVRLANTTASLLKSNPRMEESQLRNLLNVSIESRSVEVVI